MTKTDWVAWAVMMVLMLVVAFADISILHKFAFISFLLVNALVIAQKASK